MRQPRVKLWLGAATEETMILRPPQAPIRTHDPIRRQFLTSTASRVAAVIAGPGLIFASPRADAFIPLLARIFWGAKSQRSLLHALGKARGVALRNAMRSQAATSSLGVAGTVGIASGVTMTALATHELLSAYYPALMERWRSGIADYVVRADAAAADRQFEVGFEAAWPATADLVVGAQILTPQVLAGERPPEVIVGHQSVVDAGAPPPSFDATLPNTADRYFVSPWVFDATRQEAYVLSGGELPPPLVQLR